jgi:hypothetical protein
MTIVCIIMGDDLRDEEGLWIQPFVNLRVH